MDCKNKEKLVGYKNLAMSTEESNVLRNAIGRDYIGGKIQKLQKDEKGFVQGADHFNSPERGKDSTKYKRVNKSSTPY